MLRRSVVFGPEVFSRQRVGGISRYVTRLHVGLLMHQAESHLVAGAHQSQMLQGVPRVIGWHMPFHLRGTRTLNELMALSAQRRYNALYHMTYFAKPRARLPRPLVLTLHDFAPWRFPDLFDDATETMDLQRRLAAEADLLLAVSQTTRADATEFLGIGPDRIFVTPLGVDPPSRTFSADPHAARYVLYVGPRYAYKNWRVALEAVAQSRELQDIHLVCAGGPPFSVEEEQLIARSGMTTRVRRVSAPDDATLDGLYRGAAVLIYPSRYEGFGLPLLEGMVRGTPVVAAAAGSIPEVVGDAAVLVAPDDVEGFTTALERVITQDAPELRRRGRLRTQQFSWDRTVLTTMAAYNAIA